MTVRAGGPGRRTTGGENAYASPVASVAALQVDTRAAPVDKWLGAGSGG
jgi:hypothetical protein